MLKNKEKESSIKNSTKGCVEERNWKQEAKYACRENKFGVKEDKVTPPKEKGLFVFEQWCQKVEYKRDKWLLCFNSDFY